MNRTLACFVIGCLMLGGCASKYGPQQTTPAYYPACYQPIQDLRASEHNVTAGTAAGGLIGALGGALVGLLASGGKWQGAAIGGAMGGAVGTMGGNAYARSRQEAENNMRMNAYLQNLEGDISNLDIVSASARTSLQCYDRQFAQLLGAIKSRQISREAAAARYAEISSGREEAIRLLGEGAARGRSLEQQYEQAFMAAEEDISHASASNANPAAVGAAKKEITAAKNKHRELSKKTREVEKEKSRAQENSSKQTREINEALLELQDIRA